MCLTFRGFEEYWILDYWISVFYCVDLVTVISYQQAKQAGSDVVVTVAYSCRSLWKLSSCRHMCAPLCPFPLPPLLPFVCFSSLAPQYCCCFCSGRCLFLYLSKRVQLKLKLNNPLEAERSSRGPTQTLAVQWSLAWKTWDVKMNFKFLY